MIEYKENKQKILSKASLFKGMSIFFLLIFLMFISAVPSSKKYIKVFLPNEVSLIAELAITEKERQLGLMFRDKINFDQAMLFILEEERIHTFWMKNMKFPLDILWLDKDKRIVHIEIHVPPCKKSPCPSYSSSIPAIFVLELKAGSVDKNKLKLFDKIEFILPAKFST